MATQQTISSRQLELARKALWHQDGEPLTTEGMRAWLPEAGLVPLYPHAQFATPAPSFAEAVLGRPERGWVPGSGKSGQAANAPDGSDDESYATAVEDEQPEDDFASDADEDEEDLDEEDQGDEDDDLAGDDLDDEPMDQAEPAVAEGDQAMLAGDGNIPSDRETMLSDDDEFAEDEGDEIAEEDRLHAGGDPLPNRLRTQSDSQEPSSEEPHSEEPGSAAAAPAAEVNGFSPEERETVHRVLARLVEDGTAVPLNLLGGSTGEPDFLVAASAFSFVYTLRGDKNWKNEPATTGPMRVSPLAVKVYAVLKEKGAQAPHQITAEVGQGITDSATLRALNELWAIQRVLPLPDAEGGPAKWEPMSERYLRHMKAGANAGQPTALSALLSLYLAQTIAATGDEMEIFLSPLAARSRVREVVHGLSASQQLHTLVIEGKTLLHIVGALPEMPNDDRVAEARLPQRSRYELDDRRAQMNERAAEGGSRGGDRPAFARGGRPASDRGERPAFNRGERPAFARGARPAFSGKDRPASDDRDRRPFQRRDAEGGTPPSRRPEGSRPSFARPWDEERASRPRPAAGSGERRPFATRGDRPFTPREGGERRPFAPRGDRPFAPREGGERRPFTPRGDRPFAPREGGERPPFTPRGDRPFPPREGGERRPFTPRGDRPFPPREGGERRPFSPRGDRQFPPREGGERRSFTPRGDRPFAPREGGERRPFTPRGDRPFTPREGGEGRPFTPRGDRPFAPREGGERRPFTPRGDRPFAPREGGSRPFGGDRGPQRFSGKPEEGRPPFQSGAHSSGPGGAKFGGSGFGRDRGGKGAGKGFGRPGAKPSYRGPGSGPGRGGAPKRRPE